MAGESSDGERKVVESVGASGGLHGGDSDKVGGEGEGDDEGGAWDGAAERWGGRMASRSAAGGRTRP